jgi:nucleoside-diphosphate-sugar epimerase
VLGSGAALMDTTYVSNAVDALVAALDRVPAIHGESLVVSNGEPRPIAEVLGDIAQAAGAPRPSRHVPAGAARAAGAVAQTLWPLRGLVGRGYGDSDPPITRFVAEQLSTAHWFDQRRTREALAWTPRVSIDEGLDELARWYRQVG